MITFDLKTNGQSTIPEQQVLIQQKFREQAHRKYCSAIAFIKYGLVSGGGSDKVVLLYSSCCYILSTSRIFVYLTFNAKRCSNKT